MITSSSNQQIKNIAALIKRAKERRARGLFVAEGRKMFEEAPREWVENIYVAESFLSEPGAERLLAGREYETVSDAVFCGVGQPRNDAAHRGGCGDYRYSYESDDGGSV